MKINTKSIEGLKLIAGGLSILIESLENAQESEVEVTPKKTEKTKKTAPKKEVAPKTEPVEETTDDEEEITEEDLNSMSYNELKKLAKELGVPAKGGRNELVKAILNASEETEDEEEEEVDSDDEDTDVSEDEEDTDEESDDEEEDDDSDDDSDDESEDEEDDIASKVESLVEDMDDDEIRELLESVDIPTKGKRQALIDKLIHAVEDGLLDLDDDDDESEEEADDESDDDDSSEEESADVTATMTKKRKKAYDEYCEETAEAFESGEIEREDVVSFINEFNGTKDKMKKVSDEDLLAKYLELSAMLFDDDGNLVEEGAYYINDEPYCCGKPLTYDKKHKCYTCEVCGSSYDAE